jgi:hypothetical protein
MPNPPADARPPATCCAEVRAHDQVMRYRRSGVGRAVLVLGPTDGTQPLWPELTDALAARFRVIVPEVPATDTGVSAWLADFVEGLGITGIGVVAAERLSIPTLELALLDPERVARVVLVRDDATGEAGLDGGPGIAAREGPVPLLVVRRGLATGEALPLVTRFLDGDETAPRGCG